MYSYKKDKIIQDDSVPKKSFKENLNEKWGVFCQTILNIRTSIKIWYKSVNWEDAGHKTAKVLLIIGRTFIVFFCIAITLLCLMCFLYGCTQIGLFVAKNIYPIFSDKEWGWLDNTIQSLPLCFHPTKNWISSIGAFFIALLSFAYIAAVIESLGVLKDYLIDKKLDYVIYSYFIMSIIPIGLLLWIPMQVYNVIGWGILVATVINGIVGCFVDGSSGGGGGGCSTSSSSNSDSNDEIMDEIIKEHFEKKNKKSNDYNNYYHEPQITYKYIRVRQLIPNSTFAEYWEFVDGKKGGSGGSRSYQGNLETWNESMVVTDYNGFVRTYDVNGHIISQYKKIIK